MKTMAQWCLATAVALAIGFGSGQVMALGDSWKIDPNACVQNDYHWYDDDWKACVLHGTMGNGSTCIYACDDIPATVYKYVAPE